MLKKIIKVRTFFIIVLIAGIIGLGMVGTSWKLGLAETIPTTPTIPIVVSVTPNNICVGSGNTVFTVLGNGFIDVENTWIKWIGPTDSSPSYIVPDYVRVDGKELRFTIESARLTSVGIASIWVINHPQLTDPFEIAGPISIDISYCIRLPLIFK